MQKWIILGIVTIITVIGIIIVLNIDIESEYIPESEIEEIELRKTVVGLYFKTRKNGELVRETRLIDSKELLKNPYTKLINMLLDGPQNEGLERVLPENTKVLDLDYKNECVIVDFSKEVLDSEEYDKILESIERTLKELNEVSSVKILIEGVDRESNISVTNGVNLETISIIE